MPTASTIPALLRNHYFPHADLSIDPISKGEENRNFRIITDGRAYVLRLYSLHHSTTGLRRKAEIDFEISFIEHLRQQGVPTPAVIPSLRGELVPTTVIDGQPRYAVLFDHADGEHPPAYTPGIARSVADTLLHVRRASTAYPVRSVRPWPGDIAAVSLNGYALNRARIHRDMGMLDDIYARAMEDYARIQDEALPRGIIHGDIKLDNLLFAGSRVTAVLDFDDYRETYLLEELTRTIMHDLDSPTRNAIRAGCFPEFLSAFERDESVKPAELRHLKTFLRARFLYDISAYAASGLSALVDEVMEDANVAKVIYP